MRLWTLHPRYLDAKGLVALWREALLAQKVLQGATRGYRQHPQLQRFREAPDPLAAIGSFLGDVEVEAAARGYRFDRARIVSSAGCPQLDAAEGQLRFELVHLEGKLTLRDPRWLARLDRSSPYPHPLFRVVPGDVAPWERASGP